MTIRSLIAGLAALVLVIPGASSAADSFYNPPAAAPAYGYDSGYTDFEGFYAGFYGGAIGASGNLAGELGILAGVNFSLGDLFYSGLEFQGGGLYDGGNWGYSLMGLGKLGVALTDSAMVYGTGGAGVLDGDGVYAFGGGVEFAATDVMHVRGEVLGLGEWGNGPSAMKATGGLLFHLD